MASHLLLPKKIYVCPNCKTTDMKSRRAPICTGRRTLHPAIRMVAYSKVPG